MIGGDHDHRLIVDAAAAQRIEHDAKKRVIRRHAGAVDFAVAPPGMFVRGKRLSVQVWPCRVIRGPVHKDISFPLAPGGGQRRVVAHNRLGHVARRIRPVRVGAIDAVGLVERDEQRDRRAGRVDAADELERGGARLAVAQRPVGRDVFVADAVLFVPAGSGDGLGAQVPFAKVSSAVPRLSEHGGDCAAPQRHAVVDHAMRARHQARHHCRAAGRAERRGAIDRIEPYGIRCECIEMRRVEERIAAAGCPPVLLVAEDEDKVWVFHNVLLRS